MIFLIMSHTNETKKTYSRDEVDKVVANKIIQFIEYVKENLCNKELNPDGRVFLNREKAKYQNLLK